MRGTNKKCVICGKDYEYCYGCGSNEPSWRNCFCCENCREISHILSHASLYNDEANKVLEKLQKCDLSNLNSMNKNIKIQIKQIMSQSKKKNSDYKVTNKKHNNNKKG